MRKKSVLLLMGLSAAAGIGCISGLAFTLRDYMVERPSAVAAAKPAASTPAAAGSSIEVQPQEQLEDLVVITALGDSLTRGAGDSEGKGYAGYAADMLQERSGQEVALNNFGVDGLTASGLLTMLRQERVQKAVADARLLAVSIGGNDLFRGGQTLLNLEEERVWELQDAFNEQLDSILAELRRLNGTAPIYVMGLYNPFTYLANVETTNKLLRSWNSRSAETASQHARTVFVPVEDLFQLNLQSLLHTDLFHPNAKGYRLMGDRLADLMAEQTGGV